MAGGSLVLGGAAVAKGPITPIGTGGLVVGGQAVPTGNRGAIASGGLVLAGSARPFPGGRGSGTIILGGQAIPSALGPASFVCNDAPTVPLNVIWPTQNSYPNIAYYKVFLSAGVGYCIYFQGTAPLADASIINVCNDCAHLAVLAVVQINTKMTFTPSATQFYILQIRQDQQMRDWFGQVATGPCPTP